MRIILTRHGQTEWNVLNKVCGRTDVELTQKGISQAEILADRLKDHQIDLIISSPMKRAYKTACIVGDKLGQTISTDARLIEQNYGIYEGSDRKNPDFLANKKNFTYRYPGGESMMDVAVRTYSLLNELRDKFPDKNVLIVCHGGAARVINTYFRDMTNDEFFNYTLDNCDIEEYEIN